MAMIKEKPGDKYCGVYRKTRNCSSSSVTNDDDVLKTNILENDIDIKDESFEFSDDIMDKVSNNSPVSVACSFADPKGFAMDMCPVDNSCDGMLPPIPMSLGSAGPIIDGGQPLPNPVVNKQSSTLDAQYMQQHNQVFVFSTEMANKSAESVSKGHFKSIIAFHCAQPKTRKFLEKNPLKLNQFNRVNSNQWINNFGHVKPKSVGMGLQCNVDRGGFRNNPMMMPDTLNSGPGGPPSAVMNMPPRLPMWNQQGNTNHLTLNSNNQHGPMMSPMCNSNMMPAGPSGGPLSSPMNSVLPGQVGLNSAGMMHGSMPLKCQSQSSSMDMITETNNSNPLLSNNVLPPLSNFPDDQFPLSPCANNSLTGVKVPDENLTPQQRLRREDKMATLRRIGEMLLPENQQSPSQHTMNNAEIPTSAHNTIGVDDISSVLGGTDSTDMQMQKTVPSSSGGTTPGNTGSGPLTDWQKMQPFFEDRKRVTEVGGRCSSARSQGPPPPYHQTTRSASVPIAVPSPNPNSPGNGTSNLSLPSPRTCSGINSPASKQGPGASPTTNQLNTSIESPGSQSHSRGISISNPGTPVSSGTHLSPNSKQKDGKMCAGPLPGEFSPAPSGQQSPDSIFTRSLQNLARQQQHQKPQPQLPHTQQMQSTNSICKEPNLMPVPSPQHIQYLSTFEGQELTIQKQPNTSLKDTPPNIVSPSLSNGSLDSMIPVSTDNPCTKVSVSAPNTPLTPSSLDVTSSKYPGTPGDFTALSPTADNKSQMRTVGVPGGVGLMSNASTQLKADHMSFPCSSPQLSSDQSFHQMPPQNTSQQQARFQPTTAAVSTTASAAAVFMSQTANKNPFLDVTSPDKLSSSSSSTTSCNMAVEPTTPKDPISSCSNPNFPRLMSNNVPIDPTAAPKPPFDPISSLTQMSQQLTNSVPGSPGSQVGMMHSGMMPYGGGGVGPGGHMPNSGGSGGGGGPGTNSMNMMAMNDMGMCGGGGGGGLPNSAPNESGSSIGVDGSRMVFGSQMPPGMNMRMVGPNVGHRMLMPCPPNSGDGMPGPMGLPKGANMPPGPYPMMGGPGGMPPQQQRMMRPPGGVPLSNAYNGPNIQVKPNAPNTIQYLPNRSQSVTMGGVRGPPSLEFLRYQNPNAMPPNMDNKMPHPHQQQQQQQPPQQQQQQHQPPPQHNMNYFPNTYPGGGNHMNDMMGPGGNINCGMPPGGGPMVRGPLPPGMRGVNPGQGPPPPNMLRMGGGGNQMAMPSFNEQMYPPGGGGGGSGGGGPNVGMPNNNCHMFMGGGGGGPNPGSKMGPMSMGGNLAPDATQPLPPSMAQSNNFKNTSFMNSSGGLSDMDNPHFQSGFYQFQQQLYATNTRNQVNSQPMSAPNDQYYVPK